MHMAINPLFEPALLPTPPERLHSLPNAADLAPVTNALEAVLAKRTDSLPLNMSDQQGAAVNRLMKVTRRGKPFVKDTHDLFSTLMVSLRPETKRQFFKSYPNSFTTDAAIINLSSLKFSQSQRSPDPKDPSRIITTTTTTTFSMSREMAKSICQHFMDAHVIENAADPHSMTFKDRGVYTIQPKGLHILERFISKNGIAANHLMIVFATQPITMKLLHLERRSQDDEIMVNRAAIELLFRRFAGRQPNMSKMSEDDFYHHLSTGKLGQPITGSVDDVDLALGVAIHRYTTLLKDKRGETTTDLVFPAIAALHWLIDFTTIVCIEEAAEMAAHFVRYGLITMVSDRTLKFSDEKVAVARSGCPGGGAGANMDEAEFRYADKVLYKITPEGSRTAKWDTAARNKQSLLNAASLASVSARSSVDSGSDPVTPVENPTGNIASATDQKLMRKSSMTDRLRLDYLDSSRDEGTTMAGQVQLDSQTGNLHKDSHTAKLRQILEEPILRSLFREFLRGNFCEENLTFWLDCQDFKRRFNTTSSAHSDLDAQGRLKQTGLAAMEKHQQDVMAMAFLIYNTYLAPASPSEINIDHNLREELLSYMSKIAIEVRAKEGVSTNRTDPLDPAVAARALHASQVQTIVRLYERIQGYIFRLMATDSVPKFCKTERYVILMRTTAHLEDADSTGSVLGGLSINDDPDACRLPSGGPPMLRSSSEEGTKAYITISQAANEKHAATLKQKQHVLQRQHDMQKTPSPQRKDSSKQR